MNYTNPSIGDILLISLIGFVTVFIVLIVLMCIIILISKLFGEKKAAAPVAETAPTPTEKKDDYTGVKLHGVPDKTAAMLMAIVADDLQMPLDNLRFISIKEIN